MSPLMLERDRSTSPRGSDLFISSVARYDDIRRLVDIEFHAFRNEKTNQVLSYRDNHQPNHLFRAVGQYEAAMIKNEAYRRRMKKTLPRELESGNAVTASGTRFRKITDIDTGEPISWAKTEIKSYSLDELASPADCGHENDPPMNRDWFALNEKLRRDYMGTDKHCYIGMLATLPVYQHRGAGTMLLEEILHEADEAGIECYLEATDTAKPLYERHGFVTVNELRFDPSPYGVYGYKIERQTIMVRGALRADGARRAVRSWDVAVDGENPQSEG